MIEYREKKYAQKPTMSDKEKAFSIVFNTPTLASASLISIEDGAIFPLADSDLTTLVRKGIVSPLELIKYIYDISRGMEVLHEKDLVHRDLKSRNFLVDRFEIQAKVADFGLSDPLSEKKTWSCPNGTLTNIAPELFAPELIPGANANNDHLGTKMDVFGFGVFLHEILTGDAWIYGEAPLHQPGICGFLRKHGGRIPDSHFDKALLHSPAAKRMDPSGFWGDLMKRSLQINPADRPTFAEISASIHARYLCSETFHS